MATAEETEVIEPTQEETAGRDPTDELAQLTDWAVRIEEQEREVAKLESLWNCAKAEAKAAKENYELGVTKLRQLVREHNDPQRSLPFDGQTGEADAATWKATTLEELEITGQTYLALADAGIKTLGDIAKHTAEFALTDIKGIGPAKAESLEAKLADWWAAHPEFCQEAKEV